MAFTNFTFDIDADGIALVTWDMPGRSMNVITPKVMEELAAIVEKVAERRRDQGRRHHLRQGHVLRRRRPDHAGKPEPHLRRADKVAGRRRRRMRGCSTRAASCRCSTAASRPAASPGSRRSTALPRRRLRAGARLPSPRRRRQRQDAARPARNQGRPVSRRRRHATRRAHAAAGAMRCRFLLKGDQLRVNRAKAMKLIDAVVPQAELVTAAKDWIKAGGSAKAPWDVDGFKLPGGLVYSKAGMRCWPAGERALSPRDLRQLSGGARHPAGGL